MALIDTAFDTVKDALADVTEVASESLSTIGSTISDRAEMDGFETCRCLKAEADTAAA